MKNADSEQECQPVSYLETTVWAGGIISGLGRISYQRHTVSFLEKQYYPKQNMPNKSTLFSNCAPSENSAQHKKEHTQGVLFPRTQWFSHQHKTTDDQKLCLTWMWITMTLCMITEAPFHVLLSPNFPTNTSHFKMTISSSFWVYLFLETLLFLLSTQAERAIGWWNWNSGLFLY